MGLFRSHSINLAYLWRLEEKQMKNKLDKMFESDFIRLPRSLIRKFNLNTAVMLSEIYSEYTYWEERNELQQGGWFYSTVENMYYNTDAENSVINQQRRRFQTYKTKIARREGTVHQIIATWSKSARYTHLTQQNRHFLLLT